MSLPGIEPGPSGVELRYTNRCTNRTTTILTYKLRYIKITSTIQQQNYLSIKAIIFLQDISLFHLTFLIFMILWGKHKRKT